ncbi:hypothetical protein Angca_000026 [Angiostrongylus cantonensis]|uniref:RING-type domain-containing protein n=1 Tax=Angiostrongylus cantonensis TaxID=6313 RepID=A0A0K0CYI0_ANGCA|nr:hypothetical protein Angca_000026 [Angiostrongylus cantonensis]
MIDKYLAEEGAEQEISFDDDVCCVCLSRVASVHAYPCGHRISCRLCATIMLKASVKAQEKYFRCIICRSKVYRLRYIRSNPIVAVCKPEAPFALTVLHRGVFNSLRCPITSSRSTMSSSFRPG